MNKIFATILLLVFSCQSLAFVEVYPRQVSLSGQDSATINVAASSLVESSDIKVVVKNRFGSKSLDYQWRGETVSIPKGEVVQLTIRKLRRPQPGDYIEVNHISDEIRSSDVITIQ